MDARVLENAGERRFEMPLGDGAIAAIYYRPDPQGSLVLVHTEVPSEHAGQGHASRLAGAALELIRASGRKAVFRCPFLSSFLRKHPEYSDLVAG